MSSILKALRKVESESVQADNAQPSLAKKVDPRRVIRSRQGESRVWGKLLLLGMPALTLALALWVAFQYGSFAVLKPSTAASRLSEPEKPTATQEEEIRGDLQRHEQPDPPQPVYAREKNPTSKTASEKEKASTMPAKTPLTQEDSSVEGPELKLQAIVWSESPENCFAVINGVIVRVGGRVEGVSVTEIGMDYVLFKSGQRTWKMRMMTQ